jgi:palmitoyltransferase
VILTTLTGAACLTALALAILLATTVKGWLFNTTMIEGWEIERHEAVLERGGYEQEEWWGADAESAPRSMVDPVEFPYDVGFFSNMAQAMGTSNPLLWFLPLASGPRVARLSSNTFSSPEDLATKLSSGGASNLGMGWHYEENGLNDREGMWPPLDPDKVRNARLWRQRRREENEYRQQQRQGLRNPALPDMNLSPEEEKEAFRRRQERDLQRWRGRTTRAQILDELEEVHETHQSDGEGEGDYDFVDEAYSRNPGTTTTTSSRGYADSAGGPPRRPGQNIVVNEGKSGWVNAEGEHLGDYGVDEDAEFDDDYVYDGPGDHVDCHTPHILDHDDEEVPLAELIRRRKVHTKEWEDI